MIPTVQLGDLTQVAVQVQRLEALGRGLAVYIPPQMNAQTANIARLLAQHIQNHSELVFVVDLGAVNQTLLVAQARTTNLVNSAFALMPTMSTAISASSFPSDFVGLTNQGIYERQHFNGIAPHVSGNVIYSDHGSARTEVQTGPKGRPAPRIDLPERLQWNFFRANGGQGTPPQNYQQQAAAAVAAHPHIPAGVWGFDRVRQTAAGAPNSISSPVTSTSARINMHLFRQC